MICESKIILNSRHPDGRKGTTFLLRYPRIIHSEFMTHRVMSRNASSSRAIPVAKMLSWSSDEMYIPRFRKNKPGMQPGEPLDPALQAAAEDIWKNAALHCLESSRVLADLGVHKQWANRMLEWFGYINVLVTSTQWSNFFALRTETNEDGTPVPQDEIWHLAKLMKEQLDNEPVNLLGEGEWHLPFVGDEDYRFAKNLVHYHPDELARLQRLSVARCASLSYKTVDGEPMTEEKAETIYKKLLSKHPIHASPAEHQFTFDEKVTDYQYMGTHRWHWKQPELGGNLGPGFIQLRKTIPGECL